MESFYKASKKVKLNEVIKFKNDFSCKLIKKDSVIAEVKFNQKYEAVISYLNKFGNLPLPPYIKSHSNRDLDENIIKPYLQKMLVLLQALQLDYILIKI